MPFEPIEIGLLRAGTERVRGGLEPVTGDLMAVAGQLCPLAVRLQELCADEAIPEIIDATNKERVARLVQALFAAAGIAPSVTFALRTCVSTTRAGGACRLARSRPA
jgi:hypothetical protein